MASVSQRVDAARKGRWTLSVQAGRSGTIDTEQRESAVAEVSSSAGDSVVRRDRSDGHGLGRRQGRQPRRADRGRPAGAARLRGHRRRLPRRHGRPASRERARRRRWRVPTRRLRPSLDAAAAEAQDLDRTTPIPDDLAAAILDAYHRLGDRRVGSPCGPRAPSEDAGDTSFAGMNATFTNVAGDEELLAARRRLLGVALRRPGHLLPGRAQDVDRGAGHRRGRPGDGRLGALGRDVHRRPVDRRHRPHRDRGRLRPGRGRRERAGRARHLRRRPRTGPRLLASASGTQVVQDRPRARRRTTSESTSTADEAHARVLTDDEVLELAAPGPRGRGALRLAPGHRVGHRPAARPTSSSRARSRRSAARGRRAPAPTPGTAAGPGPGGLARPRLGRGARARSPDEGDQLARRRGPGGADDQPRLGARPCAAPRRSSPTAAG